MGYLSDGQKIEKEFINLQVNNGKTIIYPSKDQDMNGHWDIEIDGEKIDVKDMRKFPRTFDDGTANPCLNENYHVLELKAKHGKTGSLYGDANLIAFATRKYWIVCETKVLRKFVKKNVNNIRVNSVDDALYCLYEREGQNDLMTVITVIDLMVMCRSIYVRENEEYNHIPGESIIEQKRAIQQTEKLSILLFGEK